MSTSAFGDIATSTPELFTGITLNNGNNINPDSPSFTDLNYGITDDSSVFKITVNTSGDADPEVTYYFHCEINGIIYYTSFTLLTGSSG